MKRIILVFIIVFISLGAYAQTYTITIDGKVGNGKSNCFWGGDIGLKKIVIHFADGAEEEVFSKKTPVLNKNYRIVRTYSVQKKIIEVKFHTIARQQNWLGCSTFNPKKPAYIFSNCHYKEYKKSDIYHPDIKGEAIISLTPNMELNFISTTNSIACSDKEIGIQATSGFSLLGGLYNWEFLDVIDTPATWKPILNKNGEKTIFLKLSDLYLDTKDRRKAINKNIRVRLNPSCNKNRAVTNELTIKYLPTAPKVAQKPEILPLECSYSKSAGIRMYFKRQIHNFEAVDINLLRKLDHETTYVSYDNNINIQQFGVVLPSSPWLPRKYSYNWQPTSGKELIAGQYKIEVTGYTRGGDSANPFCEMYEYEFEVEAPDPVDFTAETTGHQTCYGTDNGKVKIKITSGGAGDYEYSFNNWATATSFTGPEKEVTGLAPNTYSVQVRKKTNQCLALDAQGNPKRIGVTISGATQITHKIELITHPGAPQKTDGKIVFSSVSGGTPFNSVMGDYYTARLMLHGSPSSAIDYTAYTNGFEIPNLPAGNHIIRYTDNSSGCISEIKLPEIKAPAPITFDIEKQDPSCSEANGKLRIVNIKGGYPPYKFKWKRNAIPYSESPTVIGRKGNYAVIVTDKRLGWKEKTNIEFDNIPDPIKITNIEVKKTIRCHNRKAEVKISATGGSKKYYFGVKDLGGWHWQVSNTFELYGSIEGRTYTFRVKDRSEEKCISAISKSIVIKAPPKIRFKPIEVTHNTVSGDNKGEIKMEIKGGVPEYKTLLWRRNGAPISYRGELTEVDTGVYTLHVKKLIAGTYTLTVIDANDCKRVSQSVEITDPINLTVSTVDVPCFNANTGEIVLNPQGGTPPYSFSIDNEETYISVDDLTNNTIEGLAARDYHVWLQDAKGRKIANAISATITQPDKIIVSQASLVDVTTVDGTNGGISIDVAGGVDPYSFLWSKQDDVTFVSSDKDITNLSSGSYTVSVTDGNNCMVQKIFEIREPLPIGVDITVTNPVLCHDDALGELKATVSGGYPIESVPSDFEYRWYKVENTVDTALNTDVSLNSLKELGAGTYKVVVKDTQGATAETTLNLTEPEDLKVILTTQTDLSCYDEATGSIDITVTGGPKDPDTGVYLPYAYSWTKVDDPDFTAATEDLTGIKAGNYKVVVVDDNLCTTSLEVTIQQPEASLSISNVVATGLTGYQTQNGSITLDITGGTKPYSYEWSNLDDPVYTASSEDIYELKKGTYQLSVVDSNQCSIYTTIEIEEPEKLEVKITPLAADQQIRCAGEQTKVPLVTTTSGGVGEYVYQWYHHTKPDIVLFTTANTPSTVVAGTYTVIVTDDNQNTHSDTYTVEEPEELKFTETVTHLKCATNTNGKIDVTIQGGVAPYRYLWSNGEDTQDIDGLSAGNYTLKVTDANDCKYEKMIAVTEPQALNVVGNIIRFYPSTNGANDGSITVNIEGGTSPYTYEWKDDNGMIQNATTNVLSNTGTGKYSLTVIDSNECKLEIKDVDTFEPPALEVSIQTASVVLCAGNTDSGSLKAIAKGGRPFNSTKQYEYQWYIAATHTPIGTDHSVLDEIESGDYYVEVTDAIGHTVTSAVYTLEQPDALEMIFDVDYTNCGDGNDWTIIPKIKGGTSPYQYAWNTGAVSDRLDNVMVGSYSVTITDSRGCSLTDEIHLTAPGALGVSPILTMPSCYNACDGSILLGVEGGTLPYTYEWSNGAVQRDLKAICPGTYAVLITDSKGCQITHEITLDNTEELIVDLGEDVTLCKDQRIEINATITDPNATYQWSSSNGYSSTTPSIEISDPGSYQVIVTNSKGCLAVDSIFVDRVTDVIDAQFWASTYVYTGDTFVIVDNSDPFPDYLEWVFPEEAIVSYQDGNYAELSFDTPGEYEITLQTYLGLCKATTTKKVIIIDKALEEEDDDENEEGIHSYIDYLIYPNPTKGKFTVDVSLPKSQDVHLRIHNIVNNQLIDSRSGSDKDTYSFEYDMSSLTSGVYFLLLETASARQVKKLIIE
ncbi:T9SS type A sorting domain-containing protein [Aquimarina sediminis]|uniref:T9SS type A sorting domain-containing protein n=1 Tax=Aquimarina sediminis TaxID=2070536 RepID=UPI000CA005EB|nr:T9SS type A sorting domain-containing protein [Aquimarina sediminis]